MALHAEVLAVVAVAGAEEEINPNDSWKKYFFDFNYSSCTDCRFKILLFEIMPPNCSGNTQHRHYCYTAIRTTNHLTSLHTIIETYILWRQSFE